MEDHRLPRTGNAPLAIVGELVAESDGHHQGGRERNRWHDLAIYRLANGRYAVAVAYRTQWQGELEYHRAATAADPAAVAAMLREYDPASRVAGYPAGEHYRERQEALLRDIRNRYQAQVGEILDRDEFAVTADREASDGPDC